MTLPADGHVHSEWSWDAPGGSMARTCARAVELGLPAVAFTEHADATAWPVRDADLEGFEHLRAFVEDGVLTPPPLDVEGYLVSVERCRDAFPGLRVISGVELGEPHRHPELAARLLADSRLDRVLGSLHCLPVGDRFAEVPELYRSRPAEQAVRDYLAEVPRLVAGADGFAVLAHVDYVLRSWPDTAGPYDPAVFEDAFRPALRSVAATGRVLEVNTRGVLRPELVRWWREEGGEALTFGSDAHDPAAVGRGFADAAAMVEAAGFRAGRHPYDVWVRG